MFLRRNLVCFYCGRRSSQKKTAGLREWRCGSCEAINYLDESGNTTDPPVSDNAEISSRYAGRGEAATSPELGPLTESLFCATCLKNQYLLAHNLAEYLPESDDPRYPEYERNLPGYRARLEARYPPVCAECEPRVRARLRTTGYAAQTDHLRRMAEFTKQNRNDVNLSSGTGLMLTLGCLCWWTGHLAQIIWHAVELARLLPLEQSGVADPDTYTGVWNPILMRLRSIPLLENARGPISLWSLILSASSIWWNPAIGRSSWHRTRGLREFYRLQGILLLARFSAWRLLDEAKPLTLDVRTKMMVHGVACMFNIFVTIVSYRTVKIWLPPQIAFEMGNGPLLMGIQQEQARATRSLQTNKFPVETLRSNTAELQRFPGPPTPPPDESSDDDQTTVAATIDSDAMDIDTPEKQAFSWTPRKPQSSISTTSTPAPSPFRGHLPPAPISQAHRLRNPPNKPTFRKTSESRQKAFFESMHKKPSDSGNILEDSGFSSGSRDIQFTPPRFFANKQQDTGLESLFSGLVSLDDEPNELRKTSTVEQTNPPPQSSSSLSALWAILEAALTLIAVADICVNNEYSTRRKFLRIGMLAFITVDSMIHLRDRVSPSRPVWLLSDLLFYASELLAAIGLLGLAGVAQHEANESNQSLHDGEIVLLMIFTLQKIAETVNQVWTLSTHASRRRDPVEMPAHSQNAKAR